MNYKPSHSVICSVFPWQQLEGNVDMVIRGSSWADKGFLAPHWYCSQPTPNSSLLWKIHCSVLTVCQIPEGRRWTNCPGAPAKFQLILIHPNYTNFHFSIVKRPAFQIGDFKLEIQSSFLWSQRLLSTFRATLANMGPLLVLFSRHSSLFLKAFGEGLGHSSDDSIFLSSIQDAPGLSSSTAYIWCGTHSYNLRP